MVFLVRAFQCTVSESRHLSYYARVNDKATVTMEAPFSGDDPACLTHTGTHTLMQCCRRDATLHF